MKRSLLFLSIVISYSAYSQNQKNYILEINGDTISVSLDDPASFKLKNGQTISIKLMQKTVLSYVDEMFSFQYPSKLTITKKDLGDGIEQILCLTAAGNGFLIQKYKTINTENLVDLMLDEITSESKDAGYIETKTEIERKLNSGRVLKGKKSFLKLEDEINIYTVHPAKIKKGGIIIVSIVVTPDDQDDLDSLEFFWNTLDIKN